MWQQGWTVAPGASSTQSADDAQKWAAYAQQWMQNKQMLEHWHQHHVQMMATTSSQVPPPSAVSTSIDPSVVSNPPPPPSSDSTPALTETASQDIKPLSDNTLTSSSSSGDLNSTGNVTPIIPSGNMIIKGSLKSRFAGALGKSLTPSATESSADTPTKSKPLFAAYEQPTDSTDQDGDNGQGKRLPSWLRDELEKMKMKKSKTSGGASTLSSIPKTNSSSSLSTNIINKSASAQPFSSFTDNNSNLNKPLTVKEMFSNDDDEDQLDGDPVMSNDENSNSSNSRALYKPTEFESTKHQKHHSDTKSSKSKGSKSSELSSSEREELLTRSYKFWTTELLLEVTNQEMQSIAKEVFNYEKGLLIKQELKKNSKPLNLAYDEDDNNDEDEEDEARVREEDSEFLRKRGEAKRKAYEAKFHLEQEVLEEKNTSSRSKGSRRSRSRSRGRGRYDEKSRRDGSPARRRSRSRRRRDRSRSGSPRGRTSGSGHSRRDHHHRSRSRETRRDRHHRSRSKTKNKKKNKKRSHSRSASSSSSSSSSSRSSSSRSKRK